MLNILLVLRESSTSVASLLEGHKVDKLLEDEHVSQKLTKTNYDLALLEGCSQLLPTIKVSDPRIEIIIIGNGDLDEVEAIKQGATAYFSSPVDLKRLKKSIDNIRDLIDMHRETGQLEKKLYDKYIFSGVVGKNPQMLDIFNFTRRIAPYYKTVTIMGETGTGKEEIAKVLHSINPGAKKPFIVCNCGGLVENLIESELFGHKKGAFTGAITDKMGIFEAAAEGTVFLDEIGELPLSFQPHLLRVLQNGDFRRIGSNLSMKAKCRVIAATNRDLAKDVKAGRFREDLFYRLTPLTIHIPPLRERKDDIPFLWRFLLEKFCRKSQREIFGISRPAQTALMTYDWPGNVRELENIIERAAILTTESFIRLEDLPPSIRERNHKKAYVPTKLDDLIKDHIEAVLQQCGGNRTNAAKVLAISRRALLRKIDKYSIQ